MRPEPTKHWHEPAGRRRHACRAAAQTSATVAVTLFAVLCSAAETSLDSPITATWSGIGLRVWAGLVGAGTVPVVVDRRLDPDTLISLDCRDETLRDVVARAAKQAGAETVVVASTIRIVPPGAGILLLRSETARNAALAKLPAEQKRVVGTRRPWAWPDGAVPAELLAAVATETGISIVGTDSLPHDHLPAASLPPLSLAERLDLVLAQYERRIDWRPGDAHKPTGRIIPLDTDLPPPSAVAAERRSATDRRPPVAKPSSAAGRRDTFSLRVAAPLEQVLEAVAARLGLTLTLDHESLRRRGVAAGEIVRMTVKDASREQLLDAILEPLRLAWTIDADTLRVYAKPE